MGCINVEVWPAVIYNIRTSVTPVGGKNISVVKAGGDFSVDTELTPPSVLTTVLLGNGRFSTSVIPQNAGINVTVSIVCTTSTGTEVFLEVIEGRLITIDGQYIKVLKDGV